MKKILLAIILSISVVSLPLEHVFAGPQSTSYEIKDYTFGAGGTSEGGITGASNYTIFGTTGETDPSKLNSTTYTLEGGLSFTLQASVSAAPSFTNPATDYDRLKLVLDSAIGPADTKYAVAISSDNFASDTRYVQNDFTIGPSLGSEDWLTYPQWGGSSGVFVSGLNSGTTYTVKVKATQGNFTESPWSQTSNATTSDPSLTFSLDSNTLTFGNLNGGNSYTDSSKTTVLTTSTNAYSGYTVYAKETQSLTSPNDTITDYGSANSSPTTWSGSGFGYTTSDNNLGGSGGSSRFSSGTKYAGFTTSSSSPGDPVADDLGPVQNPAIVNEQFTISYRVTATNTNKAGTYSNTIIYTIAPTF